MDFVLYYRMTLNGGVPHLMCPCSLYCNDILLLSAFLHVVCDNEEYEEDITSYLQGSNDWSYDIEPVWVYMKGSDYK